MAIFYPHAVRCACGQDATIPLADGVNAARDPDLRRQILAGEFHRLKCGACGRSAAVEKSFFYIDAPRKTFILVKARQDRHQWKSASAQLEDITARMPGRLGATRGRKLRVVFGLSELREKVLAQDLGLDDRGVEYLKVRVINEHPFLTRRPRLRLALRGVRDDKLEFAAGYDLDDASFNVALPLRDSKTLANDTRALARWSNEAGVKFPIDETPGDHWVNMWRWSPQPPALDLLKSYANAVRHGQHLDPNDRRLTTMLRDLPRGDVLPTWAKQDLATLFQEARRIDSGVLQDAIFEVRFAKTLDDEWARDADHNDIEVLWKLMLALPASNIEGNAKINEIVANTADKNSWYNPETHDIYISSRLVSNSENFEDVVRHEIGHGVHEDRLALVDAWLLQAFGWKMWAIDKDDPTCLDEWVAAMGGWARLNVAPAQRGEIVSFVANWAGPGKSWTPGQRPDVAANHVWWRPDFGPRLACEKTGAYWYEKHASWHRDGTKAFFVNFWYKTVAVVDIAALDLVTRMPRSYAAMSPFEFFAELYALYFDLDDPQRGVLPQSVVDWMGANLGDQYRPAARPAAPQREAFQTIVRPTATAPVRKRKPKAEKE